MSNQAPNFFRQGDGALVLGGNVVYEAGYTPSGASTPLLATPGAAVSNLAGTLTGTTDGTIADVDAIALSTSDTYTDAAVNTAVNAAITSVNLQLKELQTKINELLASLRAADIIDT